MRLVRAVLKEHYHTLKHLMASTSEIEKKMKRIFVTRKAVFHLITNSSHWLNDLNLMIRMAKVKRNIGIQSKIKDIIKVGM